MVRWEKGSEGREEWLVSKGWSRNRLNRWTFGSISFGSGLSMPINVERVVHQRLRAGIHDELKRVADTVRKTKPSTPGGVYSRVDIDHLADRINDRANRFRDMPGPELEPADG